MSKQPIKQSNVGGRERASERERERGREGTGGGGNECLNQRQRDSGGREGGREGR